MSKINALIEEVDKLSKRQDNLSVMIKDLLSSEEINILLKLENHIYDLLEDVNIIIDISIAIILVEYGVDEAEVFDRALTIYRESLDDIRLGTIKNAYNIRRNSLISALINDYIIVKNVIKTLAYAKDLLVLIDKSSKEYTYLE